ncbi:MAG: hypothetical protein ACLT1J_06475 [Mediterraneibacter gnavus]
MQRLTIAGKSSEKAKPETTYRITSGNIGFGAYSDDYSFFMDGGKESRARSEQAVIENVSKLRRSCSSACTRIYAFFQEVDIDGTRSYHVDERQSCFCSALSNRITTLTVSTICSEL